MENRSEYAKKVNGYFSEKPQRDMELKEFWGGFQEFRIKSPNLEAGFTEDIKQAFRVTRRKEIDDPSLATATEVIMLFIYGIHSARDMFPKFTYDIPLPNLRLTKKQGMFAYRGDYDTKTGEILISNFEANLDYLVNTNWRSSRVQPGLFDKNMTVSKYANDTVVIESFLAGVEEYAHSVYMATKWKSKGRLGRTKEIWTNHFRDLQRSMAMGFSGDNRSSYTYYHIKDVERRALVWQIAILNKYLPSWAHQTKELSERVAKYRTK